MSDEATLPRRPSYREISRAEELAVETLAAVDTIIQQNVVHLDELRARRKHLRNEITALSGLGRTA
jgi:hypothetical protein